MVLLHILGGLTGLTSGAVALSASKGGTLHRRSGTVFVYAMLVMSASGAVIAGLLAFYLVVTALLTVRRRGRGLPWMDVAAMAFGLAVAILAFVFGMAGTDNPADPPPAMAVIFGVVALLAVFGDLRMLVTRSLPWSQRIARHLWRMCLALWIAAASFFLGQSDELPEALRIMPLLCTPVLLVLLLMFYWLVRVLFTQWRPST